MEESYLYFMLNFFKYFFQDLFMINFIWATIFAELRHLIFFFLHKYTG